jgi:hypothetical protein
MAEDVDHEELSCAVVQSLLRGRPEPALSSAQLAHVASCDACLEALLLGGLSNGAAPLIPEGFAAKVCARLPVEPLPPPAARRRMSGFAGALLALLVLVCAGSVAFAAAPSSWLPQGWYGVVLESILVVEIVSLALWVGARSSAP